MLASSAFAAIVFSLIPRLIISCPGRINASYSDLTGLGTRRVMAAEVLGEGLRETVGSSRVLVVGTGGIGCELLKNLVLTGFTEIALVWRQDAIATAHVHVVP